MGNWTTLKASDGHELGAYVATPSDPPVGSVIILQEIFGVNNSIRTVADEYAADGFLAIAPALFDRMERGLELGYGPEDMKKAFELYAKLVPETQLLDVAASFEFVKKAGKAVGVIGFCYGGLLTWLSATRAKSLGMTLEACVGYYPGGVGKVATEEPSCPVMLHFGAEDTHIGKDQVEAVRAAHPAVEIYLYEGVGHAFANFSRPSYAVAAANLARSRTLNFLRTHLA